MAQTVETVTRLAFPPLEFMRLVGPTDPALFDNPSREPVIRGLPESAYRSVLDFGCGCGRIARQMIQQHPQPARYLGIDRHAGMIDWCRTNLAPHAPGFEFQHHSVFHPTLNPGGTPGHLPFPVGDEEVTLFLAWSVFTHLLQPDAEFYLQEVARVLAPDGVAGTSWFFFDKRPFPMMQEFQNALFINTDDPTNAVIFAWDWFFAQLERVGLIVTRAVAPSIRGFQWVLHFEHKSSGKMPVAIPEDTAAYGINRPPLG